MTKKEYDCIKATIDVVHDKLKESYPGSEQLLAEIYNKLHALSKNDNNSKVYEPCKMFSERN